MNNQAAQTMPEPVTASMCPSSDYAKGWNDCLAALSQTAGAAAPGRYFADGPQGHFFADDLQLARDLANLYDKDDDWTITDLRKPTGVAPASRAEGDDMCPNCVTPWKCNGPHESTGGASVSERAREILSLHASINVDRVTTVQALAALEQALTQPRESATPIAWVEVGQFLLSRPEEWDLRSKQSEPEDQPLYTTPQPSADAVRELVKRWRDRSDSMALTSYTGATLDKCADELESLLSGGSHA